MNDKDRNEPSPVSHKSVSDFRRDLEARYLFHKENAERHVKIFKPLGFFLALAVPILSALVTFSISKEDCIPAAVSAIMGLGLTVLTILNSVLKADERFARGYQLCIALQEWKLDFDISVAEFDIKDEKAFHEMVREMDKKLSEIGREMAQGWIPRPLA